LLALHESTAKVLFGRESIVRPATEVHVLGGITASARVRRLVMKFDGRRGAAADAAVVHERAASGVALPYRAAERGRQMA